MQLLPNVFYEEGHPVCFGLRSEDCPQKCPNDTSRNGAHVA